VSPGLLGGRSAQAQRRIAVEQELHAWKKTLAGYQESVGRISNKRSAVT
jgi:hypothetical protein